MVGVILLGDTAAAHHLAYMMIDSGVAAVRPSTVLRILQEADLIGRWKQTDPGAKKKGFDQPERPHEQWHTDIAYLNILGSQPFFISVLDGFSRAIIHHDVRLRMETDDVEIVLQPALETLPPPSWDTPIKVVAGRCGFNDPLYFSRVFARAYGNPPRAWRALRRAVSTVYSATTGEHSCWDPKSKQPFLPVACSPAGRSTVPIFTRLAPSASPGSCCRAGHTTG